MMVSCRNMPERCLIIGSDTFFIYVYFTCFTI